ncbi:MAG: hypothetical protein EOM19_04415 [Candidatus Moranbacteria bacterium]|nr:hypothetical protein [Candidatus Moranbacteria bacterium]
MNFFEKTPSLEKEDITVEDGRTLHQQLLCCKDMREMQEVCNTLFSKERRERMVEGASVDRKGRKVRYYRKIGQDIFLRTLNEGGHSIENNHLEDFDRELPEKRVREFFLDYAEDEDLVSWNEITKDFSLEEILGRITSNKEAIATMIKRKTNRNVVDFIQTYCNPRRLEIIHAGSRFMEFSPYLSASVGGSFAKYLREGDVLLEMIIQDEKISSFPSGASSREGEKHVYIQHGIDLGEISRVFTSTDQYHKEVLENETIPIGEWIIGKLGEKDSSLSDQIEQWRWDKPTDDCLPVGLLERYGLFT